MYSTHSQIFNRTLQIMTPDTDCTHGVNTSV